MIRADLNGSNVFLGYYVNMVDGKCKTRQLICLSKKKKLVKFYLETYRNLEKYDYVIIKKYITYSEMISTYEKYTIIEWQGHYIPLIDKLMMEYYITDSMEENFLKDLTMMLTRLVSVSDNIKGVHREDQVILTNSVNVLLEIQRNPKIKKRIENALLEEHLYTPIDDYIKDIALIIEMFEMNTRWEDMVYMDD